MLRKALKGKIQEAKVTEANKDYNGSITIDPELMEAIGLYEFEEVVVNAKDKKARETTYALAGKRGSREIKVNGGLANYFKVGDIVHILSFGYVSTTYLPRPKVVEGYDKKEIKLSE